MIKGHKIPHPEDVSVREAIYGTDVKLEFWLTRESETSFFDNVFSGNLIFDTSTQLGKFLCLHPWFCQHVVFIWRESGQVRNIMIKSFKGTLLGTGSISVEGVEVQPVTNLFACEVVEEARQAIETYDGTNASKLVEKFHERAKQYFQ